MKKNECELVGIVERDGLWHMRVVKMRDSKVVDEWEGVGDAKLHTLEKIMNHLLKQVVI